MPRQVTWRISPTSYAFLTYSQSPDDFESAIESHLRGLGVTDLVIGHERHADGGHHYHVMAQWPAGYETRDPRAFDVDGRHPNYRNVRGGANAARVYQYCTKDRCVSGNLELAVQRRPTRNEIWSEFVSAASKPEFLAMLRERAPYEYVLHYDRLLSFCRSTLPEPNTYVPKYTNFLVPTELQEWVHQVSFVLRVSQRLTLRVLATLVGLAKG